ncbi:MAG: HD family phosphohydrolase [Acidimicrobiia bacterium]
MRSLPRHSGLLRMMVLAVAVVFTSLVLVVGVSSPQAPAAPLVGQPSPQDFTATESISVVDEAATETQRQLAANNVATVFTTDQEVTLAVLAEIGGFFNAVRLAAEPIEVAPDVTIPSTTSTTTTTTIADDGSSTTSTSTSPSTSVVDSSTSTTSTSTTTTTVAETTTTTVPRPALVTQLDTLRFDYPQLDEATLATMVEILNDDIEGIDGAPPVFNAVEEHALGVASDLLTPGILASEVGQAKADLLNDPKRALIGGISESTRLRIEAAVADIVVTNLLPNRRIDEVATNAARAAAAAAVTEVTVPFVQGQTIVQQGQIVDQVQLDAVVDLQLLEAPEGLRLGALALVASLVALLSAAFLWRVARQRVIQPRLMALFGLLLVLAAAAARIPALVVDAQHEFGFLVPASVIGYLAAIMFDPRTAALMTVPVGVFTALASGELGFAMFAAVATLAPVPLVSAVSSRSQLRLAVAYSAMALAPLAASVHWFFFGTDRVLWAGFYGLANGLASGVVALGVLPFLENLFRITTNLTLLDLTDRNHPALGLIEEKAPGTFNHSMLVGTLAGKAARSIDANPLLAQAVAYYHDLGKTVRPQYFVENQFGVTNPHDFMTPEDSAKVIRAHVTDGLKLARQYRIPDEVAAGIRQHHGTGLMRFFYHKALDLNPDVDAASFRHAGVKPQRKEVAILMLSDAVEGATRALVQHEDPTLEGISKLVDQVVGEKMEDGQLDESALTFGELTKVKAALVDALEGYYHRRIPYPGFPGTEQAATEMGLASQDE